MGRSAKATPCGVLKLPQRLEHEDPADLASFSIFFQCSSPFLGKKELVDHIATHQNRAVWSLHANLDSAGVFTLPCTCSNRLAERCQPGYRRSSSCSFWWTPPWNQVSSLVNLLHNLSIKMSFIVFKRFSPWFTKCSLKGSRTVSSEMHLFDTHFIGFQHFLKPRRGTDAEPLQLKHWPIR